MLPFKKILCPTDFSKNSFKALKSAVELARHFSAELLVVHVIPPIPEHYFPTPATPAAPASFNLGMYDEEIRENSRKKLESIVNQKVPQEIKANPVLVSGHAANEIVRTAEKENVDLIVISTHGHTGWQHLLFGSVTEKVVRISPCPVLTIHIREEDEKENNN